MTAKRTPTSEHGTPDEIDRAVDSDADADADADDVLAFPASFAQQRLWFVDQLEPGKAVYNIPYHHQVRLRGPLDTTALQAAVDTLVARHETLRTTFATVDGEPVQIIHDTVDSTMEIIDLSDLEPARREAEMHRLVESESRHGFDLKTGPLFYTKLIRLDEDDHVFVKMMSHIVVDGMSLEFIVAELEALYSALLHGKEPTLPELPLQYADFVVWHREWMESSGPKKQLEYWKEELAGNLPVIELPTDRPRSAVQHNRGSWEWIHLPEELIADLQTLSRAEGVSLFMTMLAGFNAMLHRYTRQDDILVGTPTANRNQPELEKMIAFFVNPVVLRSSVSDDPPFTEFVARVRRTALGAMAHQDVPFERLVEELRPDRDLSHNPLFQVSFTLQMEPPVMQLERTTAEPVEFDNGTAKFDLLVELWETGGGVSGRFEYDTDLFDRTTIRRMIDNYETLLRSAADAPTTRVSRLALASKGEVDRTFREWNDTDSDHDRDATVHGMVERRVDERPDAVAVQFEQRTLTYGELDRRANRLAHHLAENGVVPGDVVGLSVYRSEEMLVALLAVMKAGGTYLPLDPDYPQDRLEFIVADAEAKLLITEHDLVGRWASFEGSIVALDRDRELIDRCDDARPSIPVGGEDLVYTIHTSGSTGKPKGVQIRHRNVANFLTSMARKPGLHHDDVLMAVTTLSFDIAVLELYLPLTVGAKVIVAGPAIQADGASMARTLRDEGVTVMQATPASWKLLLGAGWEGQDSLRILCGGEELTRELAEQLLPRCAELWNMYGPTETTVWSAARRVQSGSGPVPIGDPIGNTRLLVLDDHLQPVPIGVPGELCIGGAGVARGYLDRPDLTADRFVDDPFSDDPDDRLYRTGDLCRYRPDGTLEFLGRIDLQVKVRGFRIELGEIETVLGRHDLVQEGVVTAQEDPGGGNRLIAYVIPVPGAEVSTSTLREHLASALPAYMVPTMFVEMTEWPLTNNGKIDRRALPSPDGALIGSGNERVAPRNETEREIASIWSELLGVTEVGVADNFFELGGHSLLATQIIARVNTRFGVAIPVMALFVDPVVAHLADEVATARLLADPDWSDSEEREEFVL